MLFHVFLIVDNLLIMSYDIEAVDRIKSLQPSSPTEYKLNSVDISTGTSIVLTHQLNLVNSLRYKIDLLF